VTVRQAAEWSFQIYMRDYMSWQRGGVSERAAFFAACDHERRPSIINWARWLRRACGVGEKDAERLVEAMITACGFSDELVRQLRRAIKEEER
jgi:hypothetical protein